jgi:hypothetical protein
MTETRITWRGRDNYHIACQYLVKVRRLFQKIGKSSMWTSYVMTCVGSTTIYLHSKMKWRKQKSKIASRAMYNKESELLAYAQALFPISLY